MKLLKKKYIKICAGTIGTFVVACLALMLICNQIVVNNAKGKVFSDIDSINNKVSESVGPMDNSIDTIETDSFIVAYRQPINGYKVKAVAKLAESDVDIISADLTFTKGGQSFKLYTQCFGDTLFCKGRMDYEFENPELFKKYKNKTIEADYHICRDKDYQMPIYTPFFFKDLDFDGIEELVIVHHSMAVRYHEGYDVYRIVEGSPVLIDYPPYNVWREDSGFGMTDYPEFDYKRKTISCPYPEGERSWTGHTVYGVSKTRKDTVVVNARKHLFNHIEMIKDIKYASNN